MRSTQQEKKVGKKLDAISMIFVVKACGQIKMLYSIPDFDQRGVYL